MKTTITKAICFIILSVVGLSCGPNQRILESANEGHGNTEPVASNSSTAPSISNFEQDLNAMRTADFKFIIVFRRKDGKAMEQGDKQLIANAASQANRRRLSDGDKAIIIGSNFPFANEAFKDLTERFSMENYSKPDSGPMYSNTNSDQ